MGVTPDFTPLSTPAASRPMTPISAPPLSESLLVACQGLTEKNKILYSVGCLKIKIGVASKKARCYRPGVGRVGLFMAS